MERSKSTAVSQVGPRVKASRGGGGGGGEEIWLKSGGGEGVCVWGGGGAGVGVGEDKA